MADDRIDLIEDEEWLLAGSRVPAVVENGTDGDDELIGTDDDDTLDGKGGNDIIVGLAGNDNLVGGSGDDQIDGNKGDDRIQGNQDDDILDGGKGDDRINAGQGDDTVRGGAGADRLDGGSGDDRLEANGADDILDGRDGEDTLIGGGGNDLLRGQGDDDVLEGGSGRDDLFGGLGEDDLSGGKSRDLLEGGDGDDTLDGGLGIDQLRGGAGNDVFAFTTDPAQSDPDRILDFAANWDGIDLSALLPDFAAGEDLDEVVQFDVVDGDTIVSIDADGSGFVDLVRLEGVTTPGLTAADLGLDSNIPVEPTVVSPEREGDIGFLPSLSATGTFVTFSSNGVNADGDADVFLLNLESGEQALVTTDGNGDLSAVSGDGETVFFRSFTPEDGPSVSLADLSGGESDVTAIADGGDLPSISDDGSRFAFQQGEGDGAQVVVDGDIDASFAGSSPDISPDGGFVAFEDGGQIVVRSIEDGDQTNLGPGSDPALAADGEHVAFVNGGVITWADLSGDEVTSEEIDVGAAASFTPSISNDGRFVAFRADDDGDGDGDTIYVHDVLEDATVSFAITEDEASELAGVFDWLVAPSLSGNGSVVAFVDNAVFDPGVGLLAGDVVVASVDFGAGGSDVESLIANGDAVV